MILVSERDGEMERELYYVASFIWQHRASQAGTEHRAHTHRVRVTEYKWIHATATAIAAQANTH